MEQEFDLIVVSRVLHHMPDLDEALSLFHQHLKEDGQLLLADFTKTEYLRKTSYFANTATTNG